NLKQGNKKISVGIRVNHEYSLVETALYDPCSLGSRLGVTAEQLGDKIPEGIEGIHFHSLCESYPADLEKTLQAFEKKFGHLMTRKGYNIQHLVDILGNFKNKYPVHIILEPGSAFAWETGVLVSTVLD